MKTKLKQSKGERRNIKIASIHIHAPQLHPNPKSILFSQCELFCFVYQTKTIEPCVISEKLIAILESIMATLIDWKYFRTKQLMMECINIVW